MRIGVRLTMCNENSFAWQENPEDTDSERRIVDARESRESRVQPLTSANNLPCQSTESCARHEDANIGSARVFRKESGGEFRASGNRLGRRAGPHEPCVGVQAGIVRLEVFEDRAVGGIPLVLSLRLQLQSAGGHGVTPCLEPWLTDSDQSRTHCRRVLRSRCEILPSVSEAKLPTRASAHVVVRVGRCRCVERGICWRRERVLVDHLLHQVGILQELLVDLFASQDV